jgi:DNA-binding IclR family transcriptional regulator
MAGARDPKTVKSALRILRVLEFFGPDHESASVTEICQRYGFPQSSISELLSCMVFLGFLQRDGRGRRFRPTARVSMLGLRAQPEFRYRTSLVPLIEQLADSADATVAMASRVGFEMQMIHVARRGEDAGTWRVGDSASLTRSALGQALLSTHSHGYIRGILHRLNAEVELDARIRFDEFADMLETNRRAGHSVTDESDSAIVVAAMLPDLTRSENFTLGIRLPEARRDEVPLMVQRLRGAIASLGNEGEPANQEMPSRLLLAG